MFNSYCHFQLLVEPVGCLWISGHNNLRCLPRTRLGWARGYDWGFFFGLIAGQYDGLWHSSDVMWCNNLIFSALKQVGCAMSCICHLRHQYCINTYILLNQICVSLFLSHISLNVWESGCSVSTCILFIFLLTSQHQSRLSFKKMWPQMSCPSITLISTKTRQWALVHRW